MRVAGPTSWFVAAIVAVSSSVLAQAPARGSSPAAGAPDAAWMQSVLTRWETIAKQQLRLEPQPLSWIIFYDATSALHVNADSARLPKPNTAAGTLRFAGRTYSVRRVSHTDALWVPDRDKLPLKPVAVTMTYDNGRKPITVVALPGLFHQMSTDDHAADLDKLFLNSAIHELTHTRHVAVFAHRIDSLRTKHRLPQDLGDNVIEDRFSGDTAYAPMFEQERDALFQAVFARNADTARAFAREALAIAERRKQIFFYDYTAGFSDVEDLFLVLEGTGTWAQFQSENVGVPATRLRQSTESFLRRARTWSQLEGAMLFLLLDRFSPGWQTRFMASSFPSPFTALGAAVR